MTVAREDSRPEYSQPAGSKPASHGTGWNGSGWSEAAPARILIIDDEPQISGFVGRALEHAGYEVDIATDAADGVRSAAAGGSLGYDLVILDLIMPDMDGRVALAAILRANPAQPVLILSCNSDPGTKAAGLDLGAKDYLTNPLSVAERSSRVRASLRETVSRREGMDLGQLSR